MYTKIYLDVLKKNFMIVIMVIPLLVLTFFIWVGIPIYIIGNTVADLTANLGVIHSSISLSVGLLFSLFFVPINWKVARRLAKIKEWTVMNAFLRLEIIWIIFISLVFEIIVIIIYWGL
ncbi:hypothetical protein [Gracilibacillus dipsosauri]|uniref:Uncharacterized protein n=1 Tax=Gracilibacillus dipsosauri TaxID=178340 RepID=A0A317KYG9_9BACI|nr:hypothetical protein [Gracilibacillus dipsosauri]PWU68455.1 hypothetical protein DLJ74_08395 [Gracilibacillus dipsosauri]